MAFVVAKRVRVAPLQRQETAILICTEGAPFNTRTCKVLCETVIL